MQQSSITGFFKKAPRPYASREDSNNDRQERRPAPYRPRGGSSSHSMRSESSTSSTRGSSSTPSARGNHRGGKSPRNMELRKVAEETKAVLPALLKSLPGFGVSVSSLHDLNGLPPLDARKCPGHVLPSGDKDAGKIGTRIRVLDKDSFDAAIELQPDYTARVHMSGQPAAAASSPPTPNAYISDDEEMDLDNLPLHPKPAPQPWDLSSKPAAPKSPPPQPTQFQSTRKPVAVLNLASERHPGGGWQTGAMAQEEALCYRSSLYRSLRRRFYPLPSLSVIHTPSVLLIRSSNSSGHKLYNLPTPDLPVTSVISVAALRHPDLTPDGKGFASAGQRAETKRKIRISLRVAAVNGHTKLVLGALGCGVFANPAGDVAQCFLEVFREGEFQGGWWEDVVFAVMDNVKDGEGGRNGKGNFGEFWRVLDGKVV
ncbi:hypothetical protein E8E13_001790 [Curvularia kusanoi]|uniref:Microbial-type PARG catalytic domain-containing protein n=1 Tax=Curvularia kusanoi TaxID=90978 RepID=A0A9P4THQ5_CURKU|nr:hypothetical protein E8E13_001790 [Curvularia kusanoi]